MERTLTLPDQQTLQRLESLAQSHGDADVRQIARSVAMLARAVKVLAQTMAAGGSATFVRDSDGVDIKAL